MNDQIIFFSNRASRLYLQAVENLGGRLFTDQDDRIDFLYFDAFGGKKPPQCENVRHTLMSRKLTIPLDQKMTMAKAFVGRGISTPQTYFDVDSVPSGKSRTWFVKDPMSTGGKGVFPCRYEGLREHFKKGFVIQENVSDLDLIEGKKFTLRCYVLVFNNKLYLYEDGTNVIHAKQYDKTDLSRENMFDHSGYARGDSEVKMSMFSEYRHYAEVLAKLGVLVQKAFSVFADNFSKADENSYCLFGSDILVDSDINPVLIEINDRPNLVHANHINEKINIPLIQSMIAVMLPNQVPDSLTKKGLIELPLDPLSLVP